MNKRNHKKCYNIECAYTALRIVLLVLHNIIPLQDDKNELRQELKSAQRKFVKSKECKRVYKIIMNKLC